MQNSHEFCMFTPDGFAGKTQPEEAVFSDFNCTFDLG